MADLQTALTEALRGGKRATAKPKRAPAGRTPTARQLQHAGDAEMPNLTSALTDATAKPKDAVIVLKVGQTEDGRPFIDTRTFLSEPKVSPSGKSFQVAWGTTSAGTVKYNGMAYIPIPKDDRWRYADLAAEARAAKDAKVKGKDADDSD